MNYTELCRKAKTETRETEHLILRPFRDEDEDGLLELFHDENTMRMDGDNPIFEKNDEFARRISLIRNGPLIWFFSEEKKSSEFAGYIMIQETAEAAALGFAVTAAKQRRGYGSEMLSAAIDFLHENGVREIRIKTWEKNVPCQRLAEKLGFQKVSIIKNDHKDPLTGETGDSYLYSLKN